MPPLTESQLDRPATKTSILQRLLGARLSQRRKVFLIHLVSLSKASIGVDWLFGLWQPEQLQACSGHFSVALTKLLLLAGRYSHRAEK